MAVVLASRWPHACGERMESIACLQVILLWERSASHDTVATSGSLVCSHQPATGPVAATASRQPGRLPRRDRTPTEEDMDEQELQNRLSQIVTHWSDVLDAREGGERACSEAQARLL